MLKLIIASTLALVTACAAHTHTVRPAPYATCDIRETRTANGLRLEAVARADRSVYGTYDFTISASGPGGSSDISQGGPVDLAAGQRATIGSAEIPRGRYRATLTLIDSGYELCSLERRS